MIISISGVPRTGKTEISKKLSKRLGWKLISINDLAEELGAYIGFDKKRKAKILDLEKIKKYIKKLDGNLILEGHVSHEIPSDISIVLRCDPKILEKRLRNRYPKDEEKVRENLQAEILGVITSEAIEKNKRVFEVDTSVKSVDQNVDDVMNILDGRTLEYRVGLVDWLEEYEEMLLR